VADRLIWSPIALLDLHDLRAYIAESDPFAASRFIQGVFDAAERLTHFRSRDALFRSSAIPASARSLSARAVLFID